MKIPNFYWLASGNNFGDILTPHILNYFNIKHNFIKTWKDPRMPVNAICIGSIIERAAHNNTDVLGSGVMTMHKRVNPRANYKLVRGPLTRKRILDAGGNCLENYGDPGLILPLIFNESKKEHDVGIIPHLMDYQMIKEKYPNEFIINLKTSNPANVIDQITKCRRIMSSSLHGIITAHAYGIPAAWIVSDKLINKCTDTKFLDYYQYIDTKPIMSTIDDPVFSIGQSSIDNIVKTFKDYSYEQKH